MAIMRRWIVILCKGGARSGFQRALHRRPDFVCGDEIATVSRIDPGLHASAESCFFHDEML